MHTVHLVWAASFAIVLGWTTIGSQPVCSAGTWTSNCWALPGNLVFCKHLGLLFWNLWNGQHFFAKQMEAIPRKQKTINVCGHLKGFRRLLLLVSAWDTNSNWSHCMCVMQLSFATFNFDLAFFPFKYIICCVFWIWRRCLYVVGNITLASGVLLNTLFSITYVPASEVWMPFWVMN